MPVLVIAEVPGGSAEDDQMVKALDLVGNPAAGARIRMAGPRDGGYRIVSLWDSKDLFQAFVNERLKPALKAAGRPEPAFTIWDIDKVNAFS